MTARIIYRQSPALWRERSLSPRLWLSFLQNSTSNPVTAIYNFTLALQSSPVPMRIEFMSESKLLNCGRFLNCMAVEIINNKHTKWYCTLNSTADTSRAPAEQTNKLQICVPQSSDTCNMCRLTFVPCELVCKCKHAAYWGLTIHQFFVFASIRKPFLSLLKINI